MNTLLETQAAKGIDDLGLIHHLRASLHADTFLVGRVPPNQGRSGPSVTRRSLYELSHNYAVAGSIRGVNDFAANRWMVMNTHHT